MFRVVQAGTVSDVESRARIATMTKNVQAQGVHRSDPETAAVEFGAQFRDDSGTFLDADLPAGLVRLAGLTGLLGENQTAVRAIGPYPGAQVARRYARVRVCCSRR
jgi:hypothetical protein